MQIFFTNLKVERQKELVQNDERLTELRRILQVRGLRTVPESSEVLL